MIYGLDSHRDIGECLECLVKDHGKDWQENAFNYDSDLMPRDMHWNGFHGYIEENHPCNVSCWKCGKVWNKETAQWGAR